MKRLITLLIITTLLLPTTSLMAESFEGTSYTTIEKRTLGNIKCSLDIRLDKKVSKDFLRKLALRIRDDEPRKYERTFITYYLPGMIPGSGAWATSHFNPSLEVEILGMTAEEEQKLTGISQVHADEIIGEWLDDSPYIAGKTTLLKRNNKIFMIQEFKDGSSSEKEMIKKQQSGRPHFEGKGVNHFGEYYLIDSSGCLAVYDEAGFIKTMRPIK